MKLIVVDLDRLRWLPIKQRKRLNASKVCTLLRRDFGKKTLLSTPKNDPECLKAFQEYEDAIFKLKDDDAQLLHENRMFRKIMKRIKWFRIGVILRREKAIKILQRVLGVA